MKTYDVLIVGAGPAGLLSAYLLRKKGISCVILEQKSNVKNKVCGDGLTVNSVKELLALGIDVREIPGKKIIKKYSIFDGIEKEEYYKDIFNFPYAYGVSRNLFDEFLLDKCKALGVDLIFNHKCKNIRKESDSYIIDGKFLANKVIIASGASSNFAITNKKPKDLPLGMSSRIKALLNYSDQAFYFIENKNSKKGYAWIFPVADGIWNIGVWSSEEIFKKNIKEMYYSFEKEILGDGKFSYDRLPAGAFIGASKEINTIKNFEKNKYHVGDCTYKANFYSGEGILNAIMDARNVTKSILGIDDEL